ncbi:MAG: YggT family protein [Polaromonas sp.]|nr:YggT family protein [Polaromonas sp.]
MLIQIFAFLLETIFFVLIAAALLRAWMNRARINMSGQPGSLVMALTDWLVKPLRRALPKPVARSRVDWASVVAAALLSLVYALLWGALFGVLLPVAGGLNFAPAAVLSVLILAIKMMVRVALQTLMILVLGYAILSWVQPGSPAYLLLARLTEPLLSPLRRVIPAKGGVDLSALVLLLLLQIGLMVLV